MISQILPERKVIAKEELSSLFSGCSPQFLLFIVLKGFYEARTTTSTGLQPSSGETAQSKPINGIVPDSHFFFGLLIIFYRICFAREWKPNKRQLNFYNWTPNIFWRMCSQLHMNFTEKNCAGEMLTAGMSFTTCCEWWMRFLGHSFCVYINLKCIEHAVLTGEWKAT